MNVSSSVGFLIEYFDKDVAPSQTDRVSKDINDLLRPKINGSVLDPIENDPEPIKSAKKRRYESSEKAECGRIIDNILAKNPEITSVPKIVSSCKSEFRNNNKKKLQISDKKLREYIYFRYKPYIKKRNYDPIGCNNCQQAQILREIVQENLSAGKEKQIVQLFKDRLQGEELDNNFTDVQIRNYYYYTCKKSLNQSVQGQVFQEANE